MTENKQEVKKLSAQEIAALSSKKKAREIVHEIMNFGVTQQQLIFIIGLLSLELEDLSLTRQINAILLNESHDGEYESSPNIGDKVKIYT
jgi:hypothetical protein